VRQLLDLLLRFWVLQQLRLRVADLLQLHLRSMQWQAEPAERFIGRVAPTSCHIGGRTSNSRTIITGNPHQCGVILMSASVASEPHVSLTPMSHPTREAGQQLTCAEVTNSARASISCRACCSSCELSDINTGCATPHHSTHTLFEKGALKG
jgi:hypothetical protein